MKTAVTILLVLIFVLPLLLPGTAYSKDLINICTDANYWYPYSYEKNRRSEGLHIDIVAAALKNLDYQFKFTPLPWKRCLAKTKTGKYNALISASYKPERAEYLHYPADASTAAKSEWRITQVEYVVVSNIDDPYEYNGNLSSLPHPVRAPLGYSIVDDLKKKEIEVATTYTSIDNCELLIKSKQGVVITPLQNARRFNKNPLFQNKLKIHDIPVASKSYYFVFSKKNPGLPKSTFEKIWREIKRLRENKQFLLPLIDKYE